MFNNNRNIFEKAVTIFLTAFLLSISASSNEKKEFIKVTDGVNYLEIDSSSCKIFIGFAGWTVKQDWANNWVNSLNDFYLSKKGFGKLYSVKGPNDVLFKNKSDINIDSLIIQLKTRINKNSELVISAHSSGSFVANYFLNNFLNSVNEIPNITYFNLDGGIGEDETFLDSNSALKISKIYPVSVYDKSTNTYSANHQTMIELAELYKNAEHIQINILQSSCDKNGIWCLHDRLIITNPHNPTTFDLEKDYNNFSEENPPAIEYLQKIFN